MIEESFYDLEYFLQLENRLWSGAHGERVRDILSFLPSKSSRILDFGAGTGYFAYQAQRRGHEVMAWDYATASREFIRTHYPTVPILDEPGIRSVTVDQIFLLDVIEHVPYDQQAKLLTGLRERLSACGTLIAATDNVSSRFLAGIGSKLQALDRRLTAEGRAYRFIKQSEQVRPYYKRYQDSHIGLLDEKRLQKLARDSGFNIRDAKHGFLHRSPISKAVANLFNVQPLHSVYLLQRID